MDDIQARSEARRRKILENAEQRLKKITDARYSTPEPQFDCSQEEENIPEASVPQDISAPPSSTTSYPAPETEIPNGTPANISGNCQARPQHDDFLTRLTAALNASEGIPAQNNTLGEPSNWADFTLIIALGVIVRLIYNTKYSWIFTESMWVPFLSVAIPDLILSLSRGPPPAGFLYSFVILCGVPPHRVAYFFYAATFIRRLLQFFSLYIFSFLITHVVTNELLVNFT